MALKKFCPWRNCKQTIDITKQYCDTHHAEYAIKQAASMKLRQSKYDKTVRYTRDRQYHNFYLSDEWETIKAYINSKYKGLCLYSYLIDKKIVQADVVHHIVEIKEIWDMRLDIDNLIPLSHRVHSKIGQQYKDNKEEAQMFLRGLLVMWKEETKE